MTITIVVCDVSISQQKYGETVILQYLCNFDAEFERIKYLPTSID